MFENLLNKNKELKEKSNEWLCEAIKYKYSYNFEWMGRPIIQIPQDIYVIQELIWKIKPDLIIETGIAHGGSLIMSASMLALLDYCEGYSLHNRSGRQVVGIDIDIRSHNKIAIKEHPLSKLITMIEGSSTDSNVILQVKKISLEYRNIMVFLDSNHTHEHVLAELEAYTPFVSKNSYCVVFDSGIEDLPEYMTENNDRPWKKGNNPKTAVHEFLKNNSEFEIDKELENKLQITSVSDGFLRKIK